MFEELLELLNSEQVENFSFSPPIGYILQFSDEFKNWVHTRPEDWCCKLSYTSNLKILCMSRFNYEYLTIEGETENGEEISLTMDKCGWLIMPDIQIPIFKQSLKRRFSEVEECWEYYHNNIQKINFDL